MHQSFQCIECGFPAKNTHHVFSNNKVIKIAHCENCKSAVDKYIEYEPVIIYLDAMLLKKPAYRHILINSKRITVWKLTLLLLLCDAFTNWLLQKSENMKIKMSLNRVFYAALESDLYWKYFLSAMQWIIQIIVIIFLIEVAEKRQNKYSPRKSLIKAIVISNFGKVLIIPALLWGQTNSIIYVYLGKLFIMASNIQALKVTTCSSLSSLHIIIIAGLGTLSQEMIVFMPQIINTIISVTL